MSRERANVVDFDFATSCHFTPLRSWQQAQPRLLSSHQKMTTNPSHWRTRMTMLLFQQRSVPFLLCLFSAEAAPSASGGASPDCPWTPFCFSWRPTCQARPQLSSCRGRSCPGTVTCAVEEALIQVPGAWLTFLGGLPLTSAQSCSWLQNDDGCRLHGLCPERTAIASELGRKLGSIPFLGYSIPMPNGVYMCLLYRQWFW